MVLLAHTERAALSKKIKLRFVLLLLLLRGKLAHFFQIAITQTIFEVGLSDFTW